MKITSFIFFLLLLTSCSQAVNFAPQFANCEQNSTACEHYSPNTLIIFFDAETGKQPLLAAIHAYQANILYEYRTMNGVAISIPNGQTLEQAIAYFEKVKGVLMVNKDQIMFLH